MGSITHLEVVLRQVAHVLSSKLLAPDTELGALKQILARGLRIINSLEDLTLINA